MIKRSLCYLVMLSTVVAALPGYAWGPKTQSVIVDNAVHLIAKEGNIPLDKLNKSLHAGTLLSKEMLFQLYPELQSNPIRAIENEMYLLRSALGGKVDAYFAYRMGALGKVVAEVTSPMQTGVTPTYQNLYFSDADSHIDKTALKNKPREFVDPNIYFEPLHQMAQSHNELIFKEYQNGTGFKGVAKLSLPDDASRSVNAVADVWHTILTGNKLAGVTSESQLGEYILQAYKFYIQRGNSEELDMADQRYKKMITLSADIQVRIGDMYYDAKLFDRAVKEYQAALLIDPERREVVAKIAEYHMSRGDAALDEGQLENARDAYSAALLANALHPSAELQRLQVEKMIMERDARQQEDRERLNRAAEYRSLAEEEAQRSHFAEALSLLAQAQKEYEVVTEEFPSEYQQRTRGISDIRFRIRELKLAMMENAQDFSGSGFLLEARHMAKSESSGLDKAALKALIRAGLQAELLQLESELRPELALE